MMTEAQARERAIQFFLRIGDWDVKRDAYEVRWLAEELLAAQAEAVEECAAQMEPITTGPNAYHIGWEYAARLRHLLPARPEPPA